MIVQELHAAYWTKLYDLSQIAFLWAILFLVIGAAFLEFEKFTDFYRFVKSFFKGKKAYKK